jgi:large subunit ribosomal protein L20
MRVTSAVPRNKRKKRLFQKVKGFVGARRKLLRTAKEALVRAGVYAFRDRRRKKRDFRRLWIVRLSAAAEMNGLRYSQLINGLKIANIELDRKVLSEMAIHDTEAFGSLITIVKDALKTKPALKQTTKPVAAAKSDAPKNTAVAKK